MKVTQPKAIRCVCGRRQTIREKERGLGIPLEMAPELGWVQRPDGTWDCPFCSGNVDKLRKAFAPKPRLHRLPSPTGKPKEKPEPEPET